MMLGAKIDIYSGIQELCSFNYELCTPRICMQELEQLAVRRDKAGLDARLALKLAQAKKICMLDAETKDLNADDLILGVLGEKDILSTLDKELKRRALAKGITVITLRQEKKLMLVK